MKKSCVIVAILLALLCTSCASEYDYDSYTERIELPFLISEVTSVEFFAYTQKKGELFSYEDGTSGVVNKKTTSEPKNFEPVFRTIEKLHVKMPKKLEKGERDGSYDRRILSMRVHLAGGKTVEITYIEFGIKRALIESSAFDNGYRTVAELISSFDDILEQSILVSRADAPKFLFVQ